MSGDSQRNDDPDFLEDDFIVEDLAGKNDDLEQLFDVPEGSAAGAAKKPGTGAAPDSEDVLFTDHTAGLTPTESFQGGNTFAEAAPSGWTGEQLELEQDKPAEPAPAEQLAAAEMLADTAAMAAFHHVMKAQVKLRLDLLYEGFTQLQGLGLPVRAVPPQGAIYLSVQFALHGQKLPSGQTITTNEQIRGYLLDAAGMAVVPFQAFGMKEESGWFRLSVGAVSPAEVTELLPRLRQALTALVPAAS